MKFDRLAVIKGASTKRINFLLLQSEQNISSEQIFRCVVTVSGRGISSNAIQFGFKSEKKTPKRNLVMVKQGYRDVTNGFSGKRRERRMHRSAVSIN